MCQIENLTVDAVIHGDVVEVPTFEGGTEYIAGMFRSPNVDAVFCSEHGYLFEGGADGKSIDALIRSHLEEAD